MGERVDLEELERLMRGKLISHPADTFVWRIPDHTEHTKQVPPLAVLALIARTRELEAGMSALLGSASPHPVEHPFMSAAWKVAQALLAKGTVLP
jgi:hypothetical protein